MAFTLGYTPDERIRLADAFMREFKGVWGRHPKSVASWNLDAITMAHLADRYGVDAFAWPERRGFAKRATASSSICLSATVASFG